MIVLEIGCLDLIDDNKYNAAQIVAEGSYSTVHKIIKRSGQHHERCWDIRS